ncbi:hypothetical protein NEIELOOT_00393 [Neisseria elongata subsp. glycolytica ATCC 29315]|uniref:Uncharacterized protein n=1 Tax=Neisseria elongata subsp. glycolytica ATCC 29315 TaxID=546263 RepID=D4DMX0_NEIEG|nr:hypothetical protein NEIELOOT_00393 [Neisseria elongata subsp. glycolytica ATCC 29315]
MVIFNAPKKLDTGWNGTRRGEYGSVAQVEYPSGTNGLRKVF